jgi:hypothetical protein
MTSHDEQRLSDALRRQAATQDPHLLSLDDVTSRAGSIRRRRVATGIVAAAAVVAVVVPTALVAADNRDSSTPPPVATSTPTPSVTEDVAPDPSPTTPVTPARRHQDVSVLGDLPTGAAPRILVRVGSEALLPDGTRVKVGSDAVYAAYVGGSVVTVERSDGSDQAMFRVRSLDGKVAYENPADVDGALSVTPDRTAAAYVGTDRRIHTWSPSDGDLTFSRPLADIQLGPMAGSGSCKEQAPEGGGCMVLFSRGRGGAGYATSHGIVDDVPGFLGIDGSSGREYAGQTKSLPDGSCSEVRRSDTGRLTAATCDHTLGSFSPDGAYLSGGPAYLDGPCCVSRDVLDAADLSSVLTLTSTGGNRSAYIAEMGWEDDSHVLATVFDGTAWRIVRVGLDGSAELADAGEMPAGDVGEVPVRLAAGS